MKRKIIWSKRAQKGFDSVVSFLETKWEKKVIDELFMELFTKLESISENPLLYKLVSEKKQIHKCVIRRRTLLFYKVRKDAIEIVIVIDSRRNPKKYKF